MKNSLFSVLIWVFVSFTLSAQSSPNFDLLPTPLSLEPGKGVFNIGAAARFWEIKTYPTFLASYLQRQHSVGIQYGSPKKGVPSLTYIWDLEGIKAEEGYKIVITPGRVSVTARHQKGFFYADQTLIQLLELNNPDGTMPLHLPCCTISDAPRFAWRGMHLDESRHFFGKEFVKRYIDHLARLKMNVFHWHLTDAPGWRLEIKKYPKLTETGAWRPDRSGILFTDADTSRAGEAHTYGGFYAQEDVREILAYARKRFITILPEIEMPGHTTAALVAYPEFSCSGGPFPMPGGAKNCPYPNYCVGNEATMQFLQDVLSEVIELFPSAYIHIGGDEVERSQWQQCPRCQARKAALGLADDAALQVDFTKRIEDFLRSKGRKLMGWDEIMEGGNLTPSAGVMVWRGENLLREATAAGHEVVVTHNYYFDLYQGNPQYEPVTYGYKPLMEVYDYEPVPTDLSAAQKALVKGVQGCLWSENVYNTRDAEYMLFPRLLALAEVAWTASARKNREDFKRRLPGYLNMLDRAGIHHATSVYNPYPVLRKDSTDGQLKCFLEQQIPFGEVYYTLDGTAPGTASPRYTGGLALEQKARLQAATFLDGRSVSATTALDFLPSLSTGKPFVLRYPPAQQYNGQRPEALTDGIKGSAAFHDGNWCGFYGDDFELTIDLGSVQALHTLRMQWLEANNSWIYLPLSWRIEISTDGQHYQPIAQGAASDLAALSPQRIKPLPVDLTGKNARFIRIYGQNPGRHPVYADGKCWLFVDEVAVE